MMDEQAYFEQFVGDGQLDRVIADMTPLCWWCGEAMEYDDDMAKEVEMEGGVFVVYEPNWRCVNPVCIVGEDDHA